MKKKIVLFTVILGWQLCLSGCNTKDDFSTFEDTTDVQENTSEEEQQDSFINKNFVQTKEFSTEYSIEEEKDGYFVVSKLSGKLYGLLDSTGSEVMEVEYDSISFPESENGDAVIVELEGKYGIYSYQGELILPIEYEKISCDGRYAEYYLVQKDGRQSIVDLDGKLIRNLSGVYDKLIGDSFLTVCKGSGSLERFYEEVYDLNEKALLLEGDPRSTSGMAFEIKDAKNIIGLYYKGEDDGWSDEGKDSMIELVDENGNKVLSYTFPYDNFYEYEHMFPFSIEDGGKWVVLYYPRSVYANNLVLCNLATHEILENNYLNIVYTEDGTIFASYLDTGTHEYRIDIIDSKGKIKSSIECEQNQNIPILQGNDMILSQTGETYRIYNENGMPVTDERYLSAELIGQYVIVSDLNGEYGIMDCNGEMRVPFGKVEDGRSIEGSKWEELYTIDDKLYIVLRQGDGSRVLIF